MESDKTQAELIGNKSSIYPKQNSSIQNYDDYDESLSFTEKK